MRVGVILASGKGSRMKSVTEEIGLPKHLLPLGDGTNPTSRLSQQLQPFCDRVICIVDAGQGEIFSQHISPDIEVLEKSGDTPFISDFYTISHEISRDTQLLITTGDLIFDTEEVRRVGEELQNIGVGSKIYMQGDAIRFFTTRNSKLGELTERKINPESLLSALSVGLRVYGLDILQGKFGFGFSRALINLNTPADYERAKILVK